MLAGLPRLLVFGEIGARTSLGVRRPIREVLKQRVTEGFQLRSNIRLAPPAQQNYLVCQRWDSKLGHARNIRSPTTTIATQDITSSEPRNRTATYRFSTKAYHPGR